MRGKRSEASIAARRRIESVAILVWGNEIEDVLTTLDVSLVEFCTEFTGSWVFSYAASLRSAGVRPVIFCMSRSVEATTEFLHRPTGVAVCAIPSSRPYRALRRLMRYPYGRTVREMFGPDLPAFRLVRPMLVPVREFALYLATPPFRLAAALRRHRCEAILCQEYEYPRFDVCVLLGRLLGLPVFASFQGGVDQRCRLERLLRPFTIRSAAGLIIASDEEARRVATRYAPAPGRIASIPNPIDVGEWHPGAIPGTKEELGIPAGAVVAAWHGRVSLPNKGLDLLLDAWARACRDLPGRELCLLLIGSGESAGEVRGRISAMTHGRVIWIEKFVSDRSRLRRWLAAADFYVFPSRHEGFALAPAEAMACGLPVVAAEVSGVPELLEGGERSGGIIVPVGDAEALTRAVREMVELGAGRRDLGARARERVVTRFSREAVGEQLARALNLPEIRPTRPAADVPSAPEHQPVP